MNITKIKEKNSEDFITKRLTQNIKMIYTVIVGMSIYITWK